METVIILEIIEEYTPLRYMPFPSNEYSFCNYAWFLDFQICHFEVYYFNWLVIFASDISLTPSKFCAVGISMWQACYNDAKLRLFWSKCYAVLYSKCWKTKQFYLSLSPWNKKMLILHLVIFICFGVILDAYYTSIYSDTIANTQKPKLHP